MLAIGLMAWLSAVQRPPGHDYEKGMGTGLETDLQGDAVRRLAAPDTRVVVLFFVAADCPVSNRYVPEVNRLRREFGSRHVAFWWVFPNPGDTAAMVTQHQRQFAAEGDTMLDTDHMLVRLAHATTTPEAAVFGVAREGLHELYHGRIDDRYITLGRERPRAGRHDVEEAISAALDGRRIEPNVTRAVGCSMMPLTATR